MTKIQNNLTFAVSIRACSSARHYLLAKALSIFNAIMKSPQHTSRAFSTKSEATNRTEQVQDTSCPSSPVAPAASAPGTPSSPVKVFTNADTQRLELLAYGKGKTVVYLWTNLLNGKRYVGSAQDLNRRLLMYYSFNRISKDLTMLIHRALLKYGYSSFSLTILECCDLKDLLAREQHYIDILQPEYNICLTAGSTLGKLHNEAARSKISTTKKGTGMGEANSMHGKLHTEEARIKMAEAKLGIKLTEETIEKLRAAATGKKFTDEHRAKLSASKLNSKKLSVLDLQTGVETPYASINEASRELGLLSDSIRANLRSKNKKPYKGRYIFKIID